MEWQPFYREGTEILDDVSSKLADIQSRFKEATEGQYDPERAISKLRDLQGAVMRAHEALVTRVGVKSSSTSARTSQR